MLLSLRIVSPLVAVNAEMRGQKIWILVVTYVSSATETCFRKIKLFRTFDETFLVAGVERWYQCM